MKKKHSINNGNTPDKHKLWLFGGLVVVQFFTVFCHNRFLSFFLLSICLFYYLLNCDLGKKQKFIFSSGLFNLLFESHKSRVHFWLLFLGLPVLCTLYYFDFTLLFWLLLMDVFLIYFILKKE